MKLSLMLAWYILSSYAICWLTPGSSLAQEAKLENAEAFIFFPLVAHAFDLIVSGIGIYLVHAKSDQDDPLSMLRIERVDDKTWIERNGSSFCTIAAKF